MQKSLIVAMDRAGLIGAGGDLPWKLSADLKRFKQTTMGHVLVMGRKTFESIGRPLPGRTTIVVSRGQPNLPEGCMLAGSVAAAFDLAEREVAAEHAFVAGGSEIYALALPLVDRLQVTHIEAEFPGDTYFPPIDWDNWRLATEERHDVSEAFPYVYRFCEYVRV